MTMQGALLDTLTWQEMAAKIADGWPIILPIGAAAKAHGPHLPLGTDRLCAEAIAERMAERRRLLVAPCIGFGFYPAFTRFAGSQHLTAATFESLVVELCESFLRQGAKRLMLLNNGVSTEKPLHDAVVVLRQRHGVEVAILNLPRLGQDMQAVWQVPRGGHADERETSLMLALAPRSVRLELLPDGSGYDGRALCPDGSTGDTRAASAEKGEALLEAMLAEAVAACDRLWPDRG